MVGVGRCRYLRREKQHLGEMTRCPKAKTQGNTRFQEPKFEAAICFHNRSFEPEVGGGIRDTLSAFWFCGEKGNSNQSPDCRSSILHAPIYHDRLLGGIRAEGWVLGKMQILAFKLRATRKAEMKPVSARSNL